VNDKEESLMSFTCRKVNNVFVLRLILF